MCSLSSRTESVSLFSPQELPGPAQKELSLVPQIMDGGASGAGDGEGYVPPPEFVEDAQEALVDLDASDSTELWLIEWPNKRPPDVDGRELTLELHRDGKLGTFEDSSGKEYEVVSYAARGFDATVFTSSSSGSRMVGKISRIVSLNRYRDPNELKKLASGDSRSLYQEPFGSSVTNASCKFSSVTTNSKPRSFSRSSEGNAASVRSGRQKSSVTDAREPSKPYKRKFPRESNSSLDFGKSTQDSGQGHSSVTTAEHSQGPGSPASSQSMEHSD